MTTDIIELSKQVAEVLKIERYLPEIAFTYENKLPYPTGNKIWLAQDHARCAEIAADRRIGTSYREYFEVLAIWHDKDYNENIVEVSLADHNNDRLKAYCVAVCKAVIEQAKQS